MSLEASIAELTSALRENTAALLGAGAPAPAATKPAKADKPAKAATATPAAAPAAPAPDLKPVINKFVELAEKDRPLAISTLGGFGVKKVSELKPAQFAPFIAACDAALAGGAEEPAGGSDLI